MHLTSLLHHRKAAVKDAKRQAREQKRQVKSMFKQEAVKIKAITTQASTIRID